MHGPSARLVHVVAEKPAHVAVGRPRVSVYARVCIKFYITRVQGVYYRGKMLTLLRSVARV